MFEQQYVLNKIEQWAERLPYRTLRIEVELPGQTLTLEKRNAQLIGKQNPVGFFESLLQDNQFVCSGEIK